MKEKIIGQILLTPLHWLVLSVVIFKVTGENPGDQQPIGIVSFILILAFWGLYFILKEKE